jgi:hypothetical protein
LHIAAGCFTTALDREPEMHVNFDNKASWLSIHDELPKKPRNDPE